MNITLSSKVSDNSRYIIIPLFDDDRLGDLRNSICRKYGLDAELLADDFSGNTKEVIETYSKKRSGSSRVFLVGLGSEINFLSVSRSLRSFFISKGKKFDSAITVDLNSHRKASLSLIIESVVNAAITGSYNLGLYKTGETDNTGFDLQIVAKDGSLSSEIERARKIAETQVRIMDLVNAPANKLTPKDLGEWAEHSGRNNGYSVKVLGEEEIRKEGLNAVLAVNQGSGVPPVFIIAEYKHSDAAHTIGVVGKGVTFDTGGISIKGSANMHYMKSDMGGSAATLGTIEAVAKLKIPVNLIAIVPAVENCVDANSIKPGDIIDSYLGKTIEVIDTDAEGRLILADALAYMTKHYETDHLIDFATLTGSVIATLGYHAAGLFCNSEELQKRLMKAAEQSGERLWPLPIWKAYEEDLESDVADVKNYSGKPIAGAITAAKFLEVFIRDHPHWSHIDIAGMAFGDSPLGKQKHATAFGVNLMINLLENLSAQK